MTSINDCKKIKDFLIKQRCGDELTKEEDAIVKYHLSHCADCKEYFKLVHTITRSRMTDPVDLTDIKLNLKRILFPVDKRNNQKRFILQIYDYVRNCLSYKIPVYQVTLALIFIFLILSRYNEGPSMQNRRIVQHPNPQVETTVPQQYNYILDNLRFIEEQRTGETVNEDSSVLKFSYTVF